jgi:hypothetical protein
MPFVKTALYNVIKDKMLEEAKNAQCKLWDNRRIIKALSKEQTELKKKTAEAFRIMEEFNKRSKP